MNYTEVLNRRIKKTGMDFARSRSDAGTRREWIGRRVRDLVVLRPGEGLHRYDGDEVSWGYRSTSIPTSEIILESIEHIFHLRQIRYIGFIYMMITSKAITKLLCLNSAIRIRAIIDPDIIPILSKFNRNGLPYAMACSCNQHIFHVKTSLCTLTEIYLQSIKS